MANRSCLGMKAWAGTLEDCVSCSSLGLSCASFSDSLDRSLTVAYDSSMNCLRV